MIPWFLERKVQWRIFSHFQVPHFLVDCHLHHISKIHPAEFETWPMTLIAVGHLMPAPLPRIIWFPKRLSPMIGWEGTLFNVMLFAAATRWPGITVTHFERPRSLMVQDLLTWLLCILPIHAYVHVYVLFFLSYLDCIVMHTPECFWSWGSANNSDMWRFCIKQIFGIFLDIQHWLLQLFLLPCPAHCSKHNAVPITLSGQLWLRGNTGPLNYVYELCLGCTGQTLFELLLQSEIMQIQRDLDWILLIWKELLLIIMNYWCFLFNCWHFTFY